jgi:hypothetical protein
MTNEMGNLLAIRRSGVAKIKQNARNSSTGTLTPRITCFQQYLSNGTLVSRDSKSQVRQGGDGIGGENGLAPVVGARKTSA